MSPAPYALLCGALFLVSVTAQADSADADAPKDADRRVAALEARLAQQRRTLELLEAQVGGTVSQDAEAARVQALREQIREVLSEREFRESLMPSTLLAGYDRGFYIRSSDELFSLKVNGFLQFRWTHYGTRSRNRYLQPRLERDDRTGFDMNRLRLRLSGYAGSEDLTYLLEFAGDASRRYDLGVQWAYINYRFADEFQVRAGIIEPLNTRTLVVSSGKIQFVDHPMFHNVFGFSRALGVRLWGKLLDRRVEYYVDVVNSFNTTSNRTITPDPAEMDNNPGLAFRLVWHALGEDVNGWDTETDLKISAEPQLDFAFTYAFNDDQGDQRTTAIPYPAPRGVLGRGGFGLTTTNGLQINQFGLDAGFKYEGFSATAEYQLRIVDPRRAGRSPFTPWWLLTGQADTTTMHGGYLQVGYFLPIPGLENKLEGLARVGGMSTAANGRESAWEYAVGLNYYFNGHNAKLQTDLTKVTEAPISTDKGSLANVNDDALVWRVQLQVGF